MAFHDPLFFVFLIATLVLFYFVRHFFKNKAVLFLIAASFLFYIIGDVKHFPLIIASIVGNWVIGSRIHYLSVNNRNNGWLLFLGILFNLIPLVYYKYGIINASNSSSYFSLDQSLSGLLPLGISFYTFQQISFLVDVKRKNVEVVSLKNYMLYVTFFAQLLAGPIVRYSEHIEQYKNIVKNNINKENIVKGISLFIMGLTKKTMIANPIADFINPVFLAIESGHTPTLNDSWLAAWGSQLQLYFDFSAYSDMAIGIGLMLGIALPINFNSPLKAVSPSDCFSRWHISLTNFIRSFVFSPIFDLVKVVKMPFFSLSTRYVIAWMIATLLSMFILGVWHGANSAFILSALMIGVIAVVFQLFSLLPEQHHWLNAKYRRLLGRVSVLSTITVMSLFFREGDMDISVTIIRGMFDFNKISLPYSMSAYLPESIREFFVYYRVFTLTENNNIYILSWVVLATIIVFISPNSNQIFSIKGSDTLKHSHFLRWSMSPAWAYILGFMLFASIVSIYTFGFMANIYGRF